MEQGRSAPPASAAYLGAQFVKQTWINTKRNKISYGLGVCSVFIVVVVVALLVTVLSKSPLIFLRLAELNNGETDVKISAGTFTGWNRLNYTLVKTLIADDPSMKYHSGRIQGSAYFLPFRFCPGAPDVFEPAWKYEPLRGANDSCNAKPATCLYEYCYRPKGFNTRMFILDSEKEKDMALGRGWAMPTDLKAGELLLSSKLANAFSVQAGDVLLAFWNISTTFDRQKFAQLAGFVNQNGTVDEKRTSSTEVVWIPYTVRAIYDDPQGKFPIHVDESVIVDYESFIPWASKNLNPKHLTPEARSAIGKVDINEYAQEIHINFPPPRLDQYLTSDYDNIQESVVRFADAILYRIGFSQVFVELPVLRQLRNTRTFSLFLGLILNIVIFILLFLSVVLIYSLLMISVETRTFELGILRMIGTTRRGIIALLLIQAFFYAIPALIIGLVVAQLTYFMVAATITSLTGAAIGNALTFTGVFAAIILGLLIPVISSILPIRSALGMNLQDSLDTKHTKTKAVEITVERAESDSAISLPMVLIGGGLAVFGGATYYVLPLALLSMNYGLLVNIFVFLLIGMLLGLIILALNLEHFFELAVVHSFFFWDSAAIRNLVLKNLVAHRLRNRKTTMMYALSLGFIIFVNVAYNIEIATFKYQQQQSHGSLLLVEGGPSDSILKKIYSIKQSKPYLEGLKEQWGPEYIEDFAWVTYDIRDCLFDAKGLEISNVGQLYQYRTYLYGISSNFFRASLNQFLAVESSNEKIYAGADDYIAEALYKRESSYRGLVGSLFKQNLALTAESEFLINIYQSNERNLDGVNRMTSHRLKPLAFLDSAPRFTFSPFPQFTTQDVLVSMPTFMRLLNGTYASIDDLPLRFFLIKLADGISDDMLDKLIVDVKGSSIDDGLSVWDYRSTLKPFQVASDAMSYFFNFTTIIAMAVSFFSLMSSMFTNIYEQTKEIGVLRAMGIGKGWMYRIYIYEAFTLVLSSAIMGILIGMIVGYTMTLQQSLFTQLPLKFEFPWVIMINVIISSIIFALLASFSPIRAVLNRRVVQIFRLLG